MTETTLDRRSFLRAAAASAAVGTAAGTLLNLSATVADAEPGRGNNRGTTSPDNGGYGPVQEDPDGLLALPAGFTYAAFGRTGDVMADGNLTPSDHDGMAAFVGPDADRIRLVRNHELSPGEVPPTSQVGAAAMYDPAAAGGTTNLLYNVRTNELEGDWISLAGTTRNCAGGPTPWGSWLSCEETYYTNGALKHGYIFDVPADLEGPVDPVPLPAMGRFVHEAVAVDPATGFVYETEDRGTAGFYRFLPTTPGTLSDGGRLQMLAIEDRPNYDTRSGQTPGIPLRVTWVDIDEPDPDDPDPLAVYNQGAAQGAATFARLEGAWFGDGSIYIVSTSGGDASEGQVWEYRPRGSSGGQLILTFESPAGDVLDNPDNITVSPSGALLLCEDGSGTDWLRGVDQKGRIFDFGYNQLNSSEFAGACFSPDGTTLFVNIQTPGITFAIQGPWEQGVLA